MADLHVTLKMNDPLVKKLVGDLRSENSRLKARVATLESWKKEHQECSAQAKQMRDKMVEFCNDYADVEGC